MRIEKSVVENMADIARLHLSDEETDEITEELNSLLRHFDTLDSDDIKNIQATTHIVENKNVFREDRVWESLPIEEVMKNAPDKDARFFRVPRIIEE